MSIYPKQKVKEEWILNGITDEVDMWAKSFGWYLCDLKGEFSENSLPHGKPGNNALTIGQIRKFFGEVKRIQLKNEFKLEDVILLKPKLAYAVGKGKKDNRIVEFCNEISKMIDSVLKKGDKSSFLNFVNIFEAIVAYHKYYGGKDNKN